MDNKITTGNAFEDGKEFRFWFAGSIEKWCRENGIPFDAQKYGLRNTDEIELKWGVYNKGEERTVWASSSAMTGMSILIRGNSTFCFRDGQEPDERTEVLLSSEGDYVIWRESLEHTWKMNEDSVFLTLRWQSDNT